MNDSDRVRLLEQQLTIFAQEFHDRMDLENDLRKEIEAVRQVLLAELAELRDVYLMHKRHLEETIEMMETVRMLSQQLDTHIVRGRIGIDSAEAGDWYKAFKLLAKQAAKTLIHQKREIAPYLDADWKPPSPDTWAGLMDQVADDAKRRVGPERKKTR